MSKLSPLLRSLLEARPIPIDKAKARRFVQRAIKELTVALQRLPAKDLNELLYDVEPWRFLFVGDYAVQDVRGREVDVPVYLGIHGPVRGSRRKYVIGGGVSREKFSLHLDLAGHQTPRQFLRNMKGVEAELYSVFIHEVTHLRDELASYSRAAADKPGSKEYYNEPAEVRAFLQQIVDEVIEYLHELGKDDGGWLFVGRPSSDFIDSALEKAPTWDHLRQILFPKNQKLILRAVARAVTDEWPKLQKLYPDDMLDA